MDVDNNHDSMSEEEEYVPIDYEKYANLPKRAKHYPRAKRNFIVDDANEKDTECVQPKKKRKKMDISDTDMVSSSSIIKTMRKNKDYGKRSTTKIVSKKKGKSNQKKVSKKRRKTNSNLFGSKPLIICTKKKASANVMYSNVPLTVQEKYLENKYKIMNAQALQNKNKKKVSVPQQTNINVIEDAMDHSFNKSSNIILEPGQQQIPTNNSNNFSQTFIKLSTQYIKKQNLESENGNRLLDYFGNDTRNTHNKVQLNQKKAIEKLHKLGVKFENTIGNKRKQSKFSIKRRKISNNHSNTGMDKKSDDVKAKGEQSMDELNNNISSINNICHNNNTDLSGVEKAELALQFAADKGSDLITDDLHITNCNVYVGGLHPECDEMTLRKLFKHCGDIKQIRLDWRKKGFGFIHYQTHEQAMDAIQDMDGRLIMGQPIKCRWAKNKQKEKELKEEKLLREREAALNPNGEGTGEQVLGEDNINTNHAQLTEHVRRMENHSSSASASQQMNVSGNSNNGEVTSIGFLSQKRRMPPPLLQKVSKKKEAKDELIEDNNDFEWL